MRVFLLSVFLGLVACGAPSNEVDSAVQSTDKVELIVPAPALIKKTSLSPQANGKKFYKKCVSCHLANGDGVPAAFPPLNSGIDVLASTEEGRTYLVLVIYNGLRGTLVTENGTYKGAMVRQAGRKSPADVADVLNHILNDFYPDKTIKTFTAGEVAGINEAYGRMSGSKVLAMRPK